VRRADFRILLSEQGFDPLEGPLEVAAGSPLDGAGHVYLVQYETCVLRAYQDRVRELGGDVLGHAPQQASFVRMPDAVRGRVAAEPFVRVVVPFPPAYRLEPWLRERVGTGELDGARPYNVWVFDRDGGDPAAVAAGIEAAVGELRDWTAKPAQNPGAGATVQVQLWYRDPLGAGNQATNLSDAIEVRVFP